MTVEIGNKKIIKAWAFYDWANSVYSLVISTAVFPIFYSSMTKSFSNMDGKVRFLGSLWDPTTLYDYAMALSFLIVALLSPMLSGIADYVGNKKTFLKRFCYLGAISVACLFFFTGQSTLWVGIVFTILASIGFWGSIVFYNAYLPEIAAPEDQDSVSAKGFIMGYIGSIVLLLICLVFIQMPQLFFNINEAIIGALDGVSSVSSEDISAIKSTISGYEATFIDQVSIFNATAAEQSSLLAPLSTDIQTSFKEALPIKTQIINTYPAITEANFHQVVSQIDSSWSYYTSLATRICFIIVGLWWAGFAQITYRRLPDYDKVDIPKDNYFKKGLQEIRLVAKELFSYRELKIFLISFFLFSVGVQTIILMAGIFGDRELGLPTMNLIGTILLVQLVAILGASLFSRLSNRIGNIWALKITLGIWTLVCFIGFSLDKSMENIELYFYILGGLIGLVLGATQSLARSTYSKLLPETEDHASYFSFFDVTEKISIVLGMSLFGVLVALTGSMQWSVLALAFFFLASFVVLSFIHKTKYVQ